MGRADPTHLVVGYVSKAHGTRGELLIWPLTDHPESNFAPGVVLLLGDEKGAAPDPDLPPLEVMTVRPFQKGWLVRFAGLDDRTIAEELVGSYLLRPLDALEALADGELFYHQLLGMEVVTVAGEIVGRVVEVYDLAPAELLEVRGAGKTIHVPYLSSIVVSVDADARRMVIDPPAGLLDL